MFNEGNQIHNLISSSGSGTVINYGSGSDFLTSYGSGYGSGYGSSSTSKKVTVPTVPVPVPQHCNRARCLLHYICCFSACIFTSRQSLYSVDATHTVYLDGPVVGRRERPGWVGVHGAGRADRSHLRLHQVRPAHPHLFPW